VGAAGRPDDSAAAGRGWREVHAEWTKLRTLPSTWWLLPAIVLLTLAVGAMAAGAVDTDQCRTPAACHEDTVELSLKGVVAGQAVAAMLGVLAVAGEYASGTMRTTLTAMPRRARGLAAKAAVVASLAGAAGLVAVSASLLAGRFLVAGGGFTEANGYRPISVADGPTARAAFGSVLFLVLIALIGLAVGYLVRDTAGALASVLGLVYAFPVLASVVSEDKWVERIKRVSPSDAGMSVQATRDLDQLAIGPWSGLGVTAAWAVGLLLLGALVLARRDA
jgi:ABC-2 type transport system permease protein